VRTSDWPQTYGLVAERLVSQAPSARPMFTGASACVDAIFPIDAARLAKLRQPAADPDGAELLDRIMDRIAHGRGGELVTHWPGGPAWVFGLLGTPDRYQVGGTGPQASWALAMLGAPSVLALADRSAGQLAVIDPRVGLCAGGTVVPAGSVTPHGTPSKLPHCILEFTEGVSHGELTISRSSRIILRFGDEPVERDEEYLALTPKLAAGAGAGLVSGLNGLGQQDHDCAEQAWVLALTRAWSQAGLPVIHHELAEFPTVRRLREAARLDTVTSVGMSLSELFMLAGASGGDPRSLARDVARRCGAGRAIVHADDWALAVYLDGPAPAGDPGHQRAVLTAGSSLAAARARSGQPTADLTPAAAVCYTDDRPPDGALGDGWRATCVPAPHLRTPASTVGLGDTFVAGVLLAESLT
jgi:ADP-specific Phosphofructokinase/Glucokinase conserved region